METTTITVSIVLPTILTVIVLVGTVLNWAFHKRWFNLMQAVGLGLWGLPNAIRLVAPRLVGAYDSLPSRLLGSGAIFGFAVFSFGYLAMAIEKRGSQPPASHGPGTAGAFPGQ